MNAIRRTASAALVAGALMASACSSGGDEVEQVDAAETDAADTTAVVEPVDEESTDEESTDEESTDETADEPSDKMVTIEGDVAFGPTKGTGTWVVTNGAELLGCDGGTLDEFGAEDAIAYELMCTGARSGAIVGRFAPAGTGASFTSSWDVILASGDFGDLSGEGNWTGQLDADQQGGTFTLGLDIAFGEVAVPTAAFPRLAQPQATPCWDGFVTTDGLAEYATVDDTMLRLDLETAETTEHGAPPSECAWWLGDPELGRRVALSLPESDMALPDGETKVWLGPYDGEWDVELSYDEVTLLLSRSMTANRLLLLHPDSGAITLIDATSGDQVGAIIEGSFASGRHSVATATSPDGRFLALGGATTTSMTGVGELIVLDAENGDILARIDTEDPPTSVAFDSDTSQLVVGLFTGQLVTVDMASLEVVSEVSIGSTAVIAALGIRPDGMVVVATDSSAVVVDRLTGPTGAMIDIKHVGAARIRPDGAINSLTNIQRFEVYEIEG